MLQNGKQLRGEQNGQVVVEWLDFDRRSFGQSKYYFALQKKKVPFSMAIGNGKLMHECFQKHLSMGKARTKQDNETDEDGKKRGVSMERRNARTKE